jgi:hypothetical protein
MYTIPAKRKVAEKGSSMADLPKSLAEVLQWIEKLTKTKLQVSMCLCQSCQKLWEMEKAWQITAEKRQQRRHWNVMTQVTTRNGSLRPVKLKFQSVASYWWTFNAFHLLVLIIKEQCSITTGPEDETIPSKLG